MYSISIDGIQKFKASSVFEACSWIASEKLSNEDWIVESRTFFNENGDVTKNIFYTKNGTVYTITKVESI